MEACWAHKPEVGRSKLPPNSFFKIFGEKGNRNSYLTNQQERIGQNTHYTASEVPQCKIYSSHKTLTQAGWHSGSMLGPQTRGR